MFRLFRITVLLLILFFVSVSSWLSRVRSTDWNDSLWIKIYPVNADGSDVSRDHIRGLKLEHFAPIEEFIATEAARYGHGIARPVRVELGEEVTEQPPRLDEAPNMLEIMLWSLKMRWWAGDVTDAQDHPDPDVRIFLRYHAPNEHLVPENSVGLQKGMVGIVNGYASTRYAGANNVIIAHEFLHTLGATDKYDLSTALPYFPLGFAEPELQPRFPQRLAEIMGGRIPIAEDDAVIPKSLQYVVIGAATAREIGLTD